MYQNFIGIDIGKREFYVALHGINQAKIYTNTAEGFDIFYQEFSSKLTEGLVVLETTGGYESKLIQYLQERKCYVHRADTRKVKHFIRSLGRIGKSDKIDAIGLAQYGLERHKSLSLFLEKTDKKLSKLTNRRHDLKRMIVQEKNRLKAPDQDDLKESFTRIIAILNEELEIVNEAIKTIFKNDALLNSKKKVLKTIPGIGEIISMELLARMPELGTVNRRQIASLGGVAPHPNESGSKKGYRFTRGGRYDLKPTLFMAAMTAARGKSRLGDFYRKLVESGKKKMVALTALMRKIIVIANARMKEFLENSVSEKSTSTC